jgi:hypothetical protein
VKSRTTNDFWKYYAEIPIVVKAKAKEAYKLFSNNPSHPSIHFKRIHSNRPIFSVRITRDYRAIGILLKEEIIWFWIGSHSDYDKLVKQIRNT